MAEEAKAIYSTYWSDITILFVLFACPRYSKEEDNVPWDTNFSPHLQVNVSDTGVQYCSHENIIYEVPRHTNLLSSSNSIKVHPKTDGKAIDVRNSHEVAIVVNDGSEAKGICEVEGSSGNHCDVKT